MGAIEVRVVEVGRLGLTARLEDQPVDQAMTPADDTERRAPATTTEQALWAIRNDADGVGALLSHLSRRQADGGLWMPEWLTVRNGIRLIARDLRPLLERPSFAVGSQTSDQLNLYSDGRA
jgi:hypothetical protein